MTGRIAVHVVGSTASRVVDQLRRDRRAMVMMLLLPSLLLFVLNQMFDNQPTFDGVARRLPRHRQDPQGLSARPDSLR